MPLKDLWHDGDSRYLPDGGTARLKGSSAPEVYNPATQEPGEFLGREAKALAQSLTDRYGATYEEVGRDPYGRPLERTTLGDGRDLSQEMVRHGVSKSNIGSDFQTRMAQRGAVNGILKGTDHPIYNARRENISYEPPPSAKAGYRKTGPLDELVIGGSRGVDQIQKGAYGLASYFGDLVNSDTIREFGLEGQRNQDLDMLGNQPAIRHSSEVNGIGDAAKYVMGTVGEVLPQVVPAVAAGFVGGVPAMGAVTLAQQLGETQASLNERGLNEREGAVLGSAALKTIPDLFGLFTATKLVGAVAKSAGKKATAKGIAKDLGKAGAVEGVTEGLQSAEEIRFLLAQDPSYKITPAQFVDTIKESTIKGFIGGAGLAGGSVAVKSLLSNKEQDTKNSSLGLKPEPEAVIDVSHAAEVLDDVDTVQVSPDGVASYDPEFRTLSVPEEAVGDKAATNAYLVDVKGPDIIEKLPPETKAALTKAAEGQPDPETLSPDILNKALNTKKKTETVAKAVDRVIKEGAPEVKKSVGVRMRDFRHKLYDEYGLELRDTNTVLNLYAARKGVAVKELEDIDDAPLIKLYAEALTLDTLTAKRSSEGLLDNMNSVASNLLLTTRAPVSASTPPVQQVKGLADSYKALLGYQQVLEQKASILDVKGKFKESVAALNQAKPEHQKLTALKNAARKQYGDESAQYQNAVLALDTLNEQLAGHKQLRDSTNAIELEGKLAEVQRVAQAVMAASSKYMAAQKRVGPAQERLLQQDLNEFVRMEAEQHAVGSIYETRFQGEVDRINGNITQTTKDANTSIAEALQVLAETQGVAVDEKFARRAHGSLRSLVAAKTTTSLKTAGTTKWWNKLPPIQQTAYINLQRAVAQREESIDGAETELEILLLEHDRTEPEAQPGDELAVQQPVRQSADKHDRAPDEQEDLADNEFMHGTHIGSTETTRLFGAQQKVVRTSDKTGKKYTSYRNASVTTNAQLQYDKAGNPYIDVKDLPEDTRIHSTDKVFDAKDIGGENELVVHPPITAEEDAAGFSHNDHVEAISEKYPEAHFETVDIHEKGKNLGYVIRSVWPKGQADEDFFFWAIALKGAGNDAKNVYKLSRIKVEKPVYELVDGKTAEGKPVKKVARDEDGHPITTGEFELEDLNATHLTRAGQTLLTVNREGLNETQIKEQAFFDSVSKFISEGWRFPDLEDAGFRKDLVIWSGTKGEKHLTLGRTGDFKKKVSGALTRLDKMQTRKESSQEAADYASDIHKLRAEIKKHKFKEVKGAYKLTSRTPDMSDKAVAKIESIKTEVERASSKPMQSKRAAVLSLSNRFTPASYNEVQFLKRRKELKALVSEPYMEDTRIAVRDAGLRAGVKDDFIKTLGKSLGSHDKFVTWFRNFERKILRPLEVEDADRAKELEALSVGVKESGFIETEDGLYEPDQRPDVAELGGYGDAAMVPNDLTDSMLDIPIKNKGRVKKPHLYKARDDDHVQGTVSPKFGKKPLLRTKAESRTDRLKAEIKRNSKAAGAMRTPKAVYQARLNEAESALRRAREAYAEASIPKAKTEREKWVLNQVRAKASKALDNRNEILRDMKASLSKADKQEVLRSKNSVLKRQIEQDSRATPTPPKQRLGELNKDLKRLRAGKQKAAGGKAASFDKGIKRIEAEIEGVLFKGPGYKDPAAEAETLGTRVRDLVTGSMELKTEIKGLEKEVKSLEVQRRPFEARAKQLAGRQGVSTEITKAKEKIKTLTTEIKRRKTKIEELKTERWNTENSLSYTRDRIEALKAKGLMTEVKLSGKQPVAVQKKVPKPKEAKRPVKLSRVDEEEADLKAQADRYNNGLAERVAAKKKRVENRNKPLTLKELEGEIESLREGRSKIAGTVEIVMNGYPSEKQLKGMASYDSGIRRAKARIEALKAKGLTTEAKNKVSGTKPPVAISKGSLNAVVAKFQGKIKGLNIKVVEKQSEVSSDKRIVAAQVSGSTVTLVRENIANKAQALKALRHEVVGHLGLSKLLGQDYDAVSKQVLDAAGKSQYIGGLLDMIRRRYPDASDLELGDELLAFAAENSLDVSIFRKVFDRIAKALRKLFGLDVPMGRAEVMSLVARSERLLKKEGLGGTQLDDVRYSINSNAEKVLQGTLRLTKAATSKAKLKAEANKYGQEVLDYAEGTGILLKDVGTLVRSLDPLVRGLDWAHSEWFANLFGHKQGDTGRADTNVGGTIPREIQRRVNGVFHKWFHNVIDAMPKKDGSLKRKLNKESRRKGEEVDALRKEISEALIMQTPLSKIKNVEVNKAVTEVRAYLKRMHTYLTKDMGMDLAERLDYFPLMVDGDLMRADKERVLEIIMEETKMGSFEAEEFFSKLAITGNLIDMELMDPLAPGFSSAKKREVPIDLSRALKDYYVQDVEAVLISYTRAGIKRAVYNNRFGGKDAKGVWQAMGKLQARLDERDTHGNFLISREERKFIVQKALPAYNGTLGARMSDRWRKVSGSILTYMNYRFLTLSVFANMVDPAGIVIRSESFIKPLKAVWKLSTDKEFRTELLKHAKILGVITEDITDHLTSEQAGYLSNTPRKLNDFLFKYNGLKLWTDMSRLVGLAVSRDAISEYAKLAGNGTAAGTRAAEDLKELQITVEQVREWEAAGMPIAGFTHMNIALDRWVDGALVRPGAGIRMAWASDHRAGLLGYLKGYMWGIYETLIKRIYHNMKRREGFDRMTPAIYAAVATLPLTLLGYSLRTFVVGKELPDDEEELMKRVILRSGLLGPMQLPFDTMESADRGDMALFTLAGPLGSIVEDLMMESFASNIAHGVPVFNQFAPARKFISDTLRDDGG